MWKQTISTIAVAVLLNACAANNHLPDKDTLIYSPDEWRTHVEKDLMPFWMMASAKGKGKDDPYITYRCMDGKAYGEPGCDLDSGEYKTLSDANASVRQEKKIDGPYEWITGPHNELLDREYIRMHSRQTYAYGVAYHLTGEQKYLTLAHQGVDWLLKHAIDKENGSYTFVKDGVAGPAQEYRTSQDQSYTLMGLAFYYYLTRDPQLLNVITDLKNKVTSRYMSKDWEDGKLVRWMLKSNLEPQPTCMSTIPAPDKGSADQKELVALLDQVNAYMLLITTAVPEQERSPWLMDLYSMAQTIKDRFYNDGLKSKQQKTTGISPVVHEGMFAGCLTYNGPPEPTPDTCPIDPENCDPANHHTDFGHSIKSFWMLYLIGREQGDKAMADFALQGADKLLKFAYLNDTGSWARAFTATNTPQGVTFKVDRNKEWWIYAELDQMTATMSLLEPEKYVPYLNNTYKYWRSDFLTNPAEVVQYKYDRCPNDDDKNCYSNAIPKANLWKNGFHSTEHGLVAYITSAGVERKPAVLYYALVGKETPKLQPYYYQAKVAAQELGRIVDGGISYRKVKAEFTDIH